MPHFDTIILGAGASGLIAAIEAGKRKKKVLVIDHAKTAGRKVAISGGGKCNITNNEQISCDDYFGENPSFCKTALKHFRKEYIFRLLEEARIETEEREYGRIFCKQSAQKLVSFLENAALRFGATFLFETEIIGVSKENAQFQVNTQTHSFSSSSLLIATGGPACPQIGATDGGMKWAKQFKHKIIPASPALVGLKLSEASPLKNLQGINLPVKVSGRENRTFTEPLLFTHKGFSGPAILQASCNWKKGEIITIDFLPQENVLMLMHKPENGKILVKNLLKNVIPERLLSAILPEALLQRKTAGLSKKEREFIAKTIHSFEETPTGTEGFLKAETTRGGVATNEIHPKTMESLLVKGLFFSGEVMDIAGKLGGYNIHWAFASGYAAGNNL